MSKSKNIPDDKYRIIKIGKESLFEFIYESINGGQEDYFDIKSKIDGSMPIAIYFDMNWDTGEFIAIARNENEDLQFDEIDSQLLLNNMSDTTSSMFDEKRYVELTLKEIKKIQNK